MGILEDEKKAPHINSYFDCRWAAYGTHMAPPSPLEEHYQPPPYREYEKTPESPMGYFDFSWNQEPDDSIHPVFKIKKSSSEDDFKEVYRKMILETHPDKVEGREEEFIRVRDAWEELNF
jgi:hypothetical protein